MGSLLVPIVKTYRYFANMNHMRRILTVLFKNGLGMFFGGLRDLVPRKYTESVHSDERQETLPVRIRKTLVELGPTFVKLGQMLSTRPDVIGAEYVAEFSKLQDEVPPFSFDEVKEIVERELGRPLTEIFREFSEEPSAAASIAQGHRAVLKDGTVVFVKIQRPEIRKKILADIEVLGFLSRHVDEHFPNLRYLLLPRLVEQFRTSILEELDFNVERGNIKHFARQFANEKALVVPKVWDEFSTGQVLTMEWIDGISGNRFEELRQSGCDLVKLANDGAELALKQFFTYGFFHADPHPGNIFILPGNRICYIDFGNVGRITVDERKLFGDMLMYLVAGDFKSCARVLVGLTEHDGEPDMGELERDLSAFADQHLHRRLNNLDVNAALHDLYKLCYRQGMFLKPHIYLMLKSLAMSDKLGRDMNPNFELMKQIQPFATKLLLEQINPVASLKRMKSYHHEIRELMEDAPRDMRLLLKQLLHGKLHFEHTVQGMTNLSKVFDGVFNRLAAAIVLAAMLVGSSIVVHANPKPHWYGTSIMGLLGYVVSAVGGILLLWDMMKHRG